MPLPLLVITQQQPFNRTRGGRWRRRARKTFYLVRPFQWPFPIWSLRNQLILSLFSLPLFSKSKTPFREFVRGVCCDTFVILAFVSFSPFFFYAVFLGLGKEKYKCVFSFLSHKAQSIFSHYHLCGMTHHQNMVDDQIAPNSLGILAKTALLQPLLTHTPR